MPTLMIIIASTRPGRAAGPVADWFIDRARGHGGFDVDVVDLAELNLPLLDEPKHPRLREYSKQHTFEWSERVDAAGAFVFITAEYNHGYPATLKNAIDYLHHEWHFKPVGFVSYGGVSAGTRSMQQLVQVVRAVKMFALFEAVNIPFVAEFIDSERVLQPNDVMEDAAVAMLDELVRVEAGLRALRQGATA
jgi:NAD(P)H-dependent FMN reductase